MASAAAGSSWQQRMPACRSWLSSSLLSELANQDLRLDPARVSSQTSAALLLLLLVAFGLRLLLLLPLRLLLWVVVAEGEGSGVEGGELLTANCRAFILL